MTKPEPMLWLSDSRGVYIPRDFTDGWMDRDKTVSGVTAEEWKILASGPEHPEYWDAWNDVENNATVTDANGIKYTLYQNGDLWLIPEGMEWNDQEEWFIWPPEFTAEQYYAAARDDGWSFGDEDTPREYCEANLNDVEIGEADATFWRDEYLWWKSKP